MDRQDFMAWCIIRIKKEFRKLSLVWRPLAVITGVAVLVGSIAGISIGCKVERKKSDEKVAEAVAKVQQIAQDRQEELQEQLDQMSTTVELPWNLVLVNDYHPMKEGYVPELTEIANEYSVDSRIAEASKKMLKDAKDAGLDVVLCSAYRTVQRQENLFNDTMTGYVKNGMSCWNAYEKTAKSVAEPGTSEHALGLALDIISGESWELDESQEHTKEAKWLREHCHEYGFILRYPPERTDITGIIYEPWHYRYVGVEHATKIMEQGITLEEYLEEYCEPEGAE